MKKYITLAALLAAGTASANAVTLDDATIKQAGNTGYNSQGGTFSIALTFDIDALREVLERGKTSAWGTDIVSYNCGGTSTGIVVNGASKYGTPYINNSGLYGRWGNNINHGSTVYSGSTNLATLNWDSVTYAGLVYTFDKNAGTSVALKILGTNGGSGEVVTLVDSYVTNGSLKARGAGSSALTFGEMVTSSYYFNSALSQVDAGSIAYSAATTSPIPEPSAFGLLAGVGALALVASRRRK